MCQKLNYKILITDVYTNKVTEFDQVQGPVKNVVTTINHHFGCPFISSAGVTNVITRPHIVSARFKCLAIYRTQQVTSKYPIGVGDVSRA